MKTKPPKDFPGVEIFRLWDKGSRDESVAGLGNRRWKIQDLRKAVENEPIYQVPIAFIDLASHRFDDEDGLIGFAHHMKHVLDCDTSDPIIFDQWGRILDGRHRLVKALMEGKTTIPAKKIPDGTACTYNV